MSCGRAAEIDLAAFAADPGASEWGAFRSHYPRCADCSRAVASWSELRAALAELGEGEGHPAESELLGFVARPADLAAERRAALEAHVAACATCRTELAVLRGFDFDALPFPAAAPEPAAPGFAERLGAWLAELADGLRQPALAAIVLLLLALPAAVAVWSFFAAPSAPPPIARQGPLAPAPSPRETPLVPGEVPPGPERPEAIAREEIAPVPEVIAREEIAPVPEVIAREEIVPVPEVIAREEIAPVPEVPERVEIAPGPPLPSPRSIAEARSASPEIDLLALLPSEPPRYQPRLALAGGSLESVRSGSAVRGEQQGLPALHALGPAHVAATQRVSPTLYWFLAADTSVPVELTLLDDEGVEPLIEQRIEAPVAAGLHALSLGELGVRLVPGQTYTWFAALVPDEARRDLDVLSGAALRYTPAPAGLAAELEAAGPAGRAHRLAEGGYWLDAFAELSRLAREHPGVARLDAQRAALLEQVGLPRVAEAVAAGAR